ncbi:MAG TPA: DUF4198 domain-containing protein [Ohtaekwangia sp.]|nr:DUF4198 domain-containing protein [Ohtaekwangia sp.]
MTRLKSVLSFLLVVLAYHASAHYIWIELGSAPQTGKSLEVRIYYGEFNEGVREISGGRLEELDGIVAWVIGPDGKQTKLNISIEEKYFKTSFVPDQPGQYLIQAVNTVRPVVDWSKFDIGVVRPVYYTTKEVAVGNAKNTPPTFEIPGDAAVVIASTREKNTFRILFKGQPLANAKVLFHAPNEWSKELKTDDKGLVSFTPIGSGQYIVECIYAEKVPGNFKGTAYEAIRHRGTTAVDIR